MFLAHRAGDSGDSIGAGKRGQAGEEIKLFGTFRRNPAFHEGLPARSITSVDDNMGISGFDSDNGLNLAYNQIA